MAGCKTCPIVCHVLVTLGTPIFCFIFSYQDKLLGDKLCNETGVNFQPYSAEEIEAKKVIEAARDLRQKGDEFDNHFSDKVRKPLNIKHSLPQLVLQIAKGNFDFDNMLKTVSLFINNTLAYSSNDNLYNT